MCIFFIKAVNVKVIKKNTKTKTITKTKTKLLFKLSFTKTIEFTSVKISNKVHTFTFDKMIRLDPELDFFSPKIKHQSMSLT